MASLKEVKGRIVSVKSTSKITSAMKMVASAKLHKAQKTVESMLPYERRLHEMMDDFLQYSREGNLQSPFLTEREEVRRAAIVVFSSNSSLCGAFNSNVVKAFKKAVERYKALGRENVLVYPVGKKISEAVVKMGIRPQGNFVRMADKPSFNDAASLAEALMGKYLRKELDKVELIYHHFHSTSSQMLLDETYLPLKLEVSRPQEKEEKMFYDYILEPSAHVLLERMLPKVLHLKIYTVLLDTNTAEHAARTIAMQTATDNANELLDDLTLMYNKTRQQAITNELLDIMGGVQN